METFLRRRAQEAQVRLADTWRFLSAPRSGSSAQKIQTAFELIDRHELLVGHLYRVRRKFPLSDPFRKRLEDSTAEISHEIATLQEELGATGGYREWVTKYRAVWRANLALFFFTTFIFLSSLLLGWHLTSSRPEFASVLIPQPLMEQVLDHKRWFGELTRNPLFWRSYDRLQ